MSAMRAPCDRQPRLVHHALQHFGELLDAASTGFHLVCEWSASSTSRHRSKSLTFLRKAVEKLCHVGHDTPLVRHIHVTQILDLQQALWLNQLGSATLDEGGD